MVRNKLREWRRGPRDGWSKGHRIAGLGLFLVVTSVGLYATSTDPAGGWVRTSLAIGLGTGVVAGALSLVDSLQGYWKRLSTLVKVAILVTGCALFVASLSRIQVWAFNLAYGVGLVGAAGLQMLR